MVRGQTNTQILRYLHFCKNFALIVEYPIDAQFPLQRYYSKSREGLYESCGRTLVWGLSTCKCLAPGRAAEIDLKLTRRRFRQNFESCENLCSNKDFSKTHNQTHQVHSWTALNQMEVRKLVQGQTNTQILRYHHFCKKMYYLLNTPLTPNFLCNGITLGAKKGSTSHVV